MISAAPDADYREPGGDKARGFFAAPAEGPFRPAPGHGAPEDYARAKANLFGDEGGPAILEFELPDTLAEALVGQVGDDPEPGKAFNVGLEIGFEPGGGLEQPLAVWPTLKKQVILLEEP